MSDENEVKSDGSDMQSEYPAQENWATGKKLRGSRAMADTTESATELSVTHEEMRTVKLLNTDIYNGKYLVIDTQSREVYLVPTDKLLWSTGEQGIAKSVLDEAERPYTFDKEIRELYATPQQVRIALWASGAVTEQDAQDESVHQRLVRIFTRGVLPIKES